VSECFFHIQLTIKYRRKVLTPEIEQTIKETCEGFKDRYNIEIKELGFDQDHVHLYLQFLPKYSPRQVIKIIKSITAKQVFKHHPKIKEFLWGGEFWTDGYYIGTVSPHANKEVIINYIKNQGEKKPNQLKLFRL
jgi:REP element-mobilizing transposase RayT